MIYFSIEEFEKSDVAKSRKIDNTAPENIRSNIEEFVNNLLDPLRTAWGSGIRVNSGYRCDALNKAVKGSATSVHPLGYAVDIVPSNGNMKEFQSFVEKFLSDKEFDQLIFEKPRKGIASWLHISYKNKHGKQRKQIFTLI